MYQVPSPKISRVLGVNLLNRNNFFKEFWKQLNFKDLNNGSGLVRYVLKLYKLLCCTGKLKEIVKRHQGLVVDHESEATHLVYPAADPLEEEFARPVIQRDRSTLIHW